MLPWDIDAALIAVLVAVAFWVRSRSHPRRNLRRLVFVYEAAFVAASLVGIAAAVLVSFDPFAGEVTSPSERARAAMGVSEPVNLAATGVMAFLVPTIAAWVMLRRSRAESSEIAPG